MTTERFAERKQQREQKSDQKNFCEMLKSGMNVYVHDTTSRGCLIRLTLDSDGLVQRSEPRHGTSHVIQPAIIS